MAVSATGGISDDGHNHPLSLLVPVSQVKQVQVIRCETATACGASVDHHLQLVDRTAAMRGSRGGRDAGTFTSSSLAGNLNLTFELGALERDQVQGVGIPRDDILARISRRTSKEDNL